MYYELKRRIEKVQQEISEKKTKEMLKSDKIQRCKDELKNFIQKEVNDPSKSTFIVNSSYIELFTHKNFCTFSNFTSEEKNYIRMFTKDELEKTFPGLKIYPEIWISKTGINLERCTIEKSDSLFKRAYDKILKDFRS